MVGDLSFLHDINGLNLLRSGEPACVQFVVQLGLLVCCPGAAGWEPGVTTPSAASSPTSTLLPRPGPDPAGEARPPLTVVLVNNGGGGIFSFLPIAEALPEDVFTPLWATPQHVDLEGEWLNALAAGWH